MNKKRFLLMPDLHQARERLKHHIAVFIITKVSLFIYLLCKSYTKNDAKKH